jgi:hypothetical protein
VNEQRFGFYSRVGSNDCLKQGFIGRNTFLINAPMETEVDKSYIARIVRVYDIN